MYIVKSSSTGGQDHLMGERTIFSTNVWENRIATCQGRKLDPDLIPCTKTKATRHLWTWAGIQQTCAERLSIPTCPSLLGCCWEGRDGAGRSACGVDKGWVSCGSQNAMERSLYTLTHHTLPEVVSFRPGWCRRRTGEPWCDLAKTQIKFCWFSTYTPPCDCPVLTNLVRWFSNRCVVLGTPREPALPPSLPPSFPSFFSSFLPWCH